MQGWYCLLLDSLNRREAHTGDHARWEADSPLVYQGSVSGRNCGIYFPASAASSVAIVMVRTRMRRSSQEEALIQ